MDITSVTQLISNLGFPIAVCCMMFWYVYKVQKSYSEDMRTLTKAIENNTIALTQLESKLEGKHIS